MIALNTLIISGILKVPDVTSKSIQSSALYMSVGTTCISIYLTLKELFFESEVLEEGRLEYLLNCLKGKHGWIPFGRQLEQNTLNKDLHFGSMYLKKQTGLITTDTTGNYFTINYKFTD